jgi:gluconolactonase
LSGDPGRIALAMRLRKGMQMTLTRRHLITGMAALFPIACVARPGLTSSQRIGGIDRIDAARDALIDPDAPIELLGTGYGWAEGPVWVEDGGYLLFTDVPGNRIWRWTPGQGAPVPFLDPSGPSPVPAGIREGGANGLTLDREGRLLMAGSGARAIERLDLTTRTRTVLADRFEGRKFNSCNDLIQGRDGSIFFTDPPYGLAEGDQSPLKEQSANGVYRLAPDGLVSRIDASLKRPNGIALSPDQRTLYVTQSDPDVPELYAYARQPDGGFGGRRVLGNFRAGVVAGKPGLPDGLKVASSGHLFMTGPGGVLVLAPDGRHLGTISTGKAIANCALAPDGWLYLTSSNMLARVRTRARPA